VRTRSVSTVEEPARRIAMVTNFEDSAELAFCATTRSYGRYAFVSFVRNENVIDLRHVRH
jgi:hypothetical protein